MAGPSGANAKPTGGFQAPPPPGHQAMKAAGAAASILGQPSAGPDTAAKQANIPSPAMNSTEVLHQTRKLPYSPGKMAIGGFAVAVTFAYFALYSNKKPEATALDVAKVTTGTGSPGNSRRA